MVIWERNLHDQIHMTEWIWPKFGEHDRKISEQWALTIEYKYAQKILLLDVKFSDQMVCHIYPNTWSVIRNVTVLKFTFRMDEDETQSGKKEERERTKSDERTNKKKGRLESTDVDGPDLSVELQKLEEMVRNFSCLRAHFVQSDTVGIRNPTPEIRTFWQF